MRKSAQKTLIATALTWALALPSFAGQLAAQEAEFQHEAAGGATSLWVPGDIVTNLPENLFYGTRERLQLKAMPHMSRSRSRWPGP